MENSFKNACLPILFSFLTLFTRGQERTLAFSAGIEYALSTYSEAGKLDINGQGIFLQGEAFFSKQPSARTHAGVSGTLDAGWLHFSGTVNISDSSTQTRFAVLPLLAGIRYYWKEIYYLGMQTGALINTNGQTATRLVLEPGIGMVAPVGESLLELSLHFTGVPPMGSGKPGKTILQQGGYSFAALRIAYEF